MSLQNRIKQFGKDYLISKGFSQITAWVFEKQMSGLLHGIGFRKGHGHLDDRFTVDIYLRYTNSPRSKSSAMDCHFRIGWFIDGSDSDGWFLAKDQQGYDIIKKAIEISVMPFFSEHECIKDVIRSLEQKRYPSDRLFGKDLGWANFHIGFCYLFLINREKALPYLKSVVNRYSEPPNGLKVLPAWIIERRQITLEAIEKIEK